MLTIKEGLDLLNKYKVSNKIVDHCIGVSDVAFDLAKKIKQKNIYLNIDPKKVRIAGLLHDIGRSREGLHELNSQIILYEEGLNTIAEIVVHGFLYEHFLIKGITNVEYLPTTIENKIVVLADMYYNHNKQKVSLDERFDDIIYRYSDNKEFLEVVKLAKPRFEQLEKEIQRLLK